jgi:hypothetical protein
VPGVSVGGSGVGAGVAEGGNGVLVGGIGVGTGVGDAGVFLASAVGTGVLDGGTGVLLAGIDVLVDGIGVGAGEGRVWQRVISIARGKIMAASHRSQVAGTTPSAICELWHADGTTHNWY